MQIALSPVRSNLGHDTPPKSWNSPEEHFSQALTNPWYKLVFELKSTVFFATCDFYRARNMLPALMPVTSSSVSSPMGLGSDSVPVEVSLFNSRTYLADSMQFQLEYLLRQHQVGVWYLMPTFRGEDHDKRHLNQFFHSEAEIQGTLTDVIKLVTDYVKYLTKSILDKHGQSIKQVVGNTEHLEKFLNFEIPIISFKEAKLLLADQDGCFKSVAPGAETITSNGESALIKYFGGAVWLKEFDSLSVPFYQAKTESGSALCADLLMGIGEIVGCGQRHATAEEAQAALNLHDVSSEHYAWYLRMKKEFPLQTSGFGLGVERYLLWVLRHDDIRDIHLIPRLKGINSTP